MGYGNEKYRHEYTGYGKSPPEEKVRDCETVNFTFRDLQCIEKSPINWYCMRVLALADTHLGLVAGRTAQAKRDMANHAYQQFQFCIQEAIKHDVDYIIHAGDVFNRSQPPGWVIDQYFRVIQQALDRDIDVMIIPGNHDRARLDTSLFDYMYPNYHVFNSVNYHDKDGIRWIGVPFLYSEYRKTYRKIKSWSAQSSFPSIIICHQLFHGATFGPHEYSFTSREDVFEISDLPVHAQIITGHIHRPQYLYGGQVVYTGSTVRTSFAELIEPKGYLLLDIEEQSIQISFKKIPSQPMEVIEVDGRTIDLSKIDNYLERYSKETRILLRLLHCKIDQNFKKKLYQRYSSERWPYLRISPGRPDTVLRAQYGLYQKKFEFDQITRDWSKNIDPQLAKYRE